MTELTELQYSNNRKGPFALYIFGMSGMHTGKQWFENKPRYPDEEISTLDAKARVDRAMIMKREIRVCDGGDKLVYHAKGGQVLYGENFWSEIAA